MGSALRYRLHVFHLELKTTQWAPIPEAVSFIKVSSCQRDASSFDGRISQEHFLFVAIANSLIFPNSGLARAWAMPCLVGIRELQVGPTTSDEGQRGSVMIIKLLVLSGLIRNEGKESAPPGKI